MVVVFEVTKERTQAVEISLVIEPVAVVVLLVVVVVVVVGGGGGGGGDERILHVLEILAARFITGW